MEAQSSFENAVGDCPEVKVRVGGIDVLSDVLAHCREVIDVTFYISISASQGL